ncbi:alpha-ketoacid dehydrogenase subunit beta, partial [Candidatus Poribacteria bacterium]|nr:alpha-ketoacid dehydrogenase subunit beta [Candidatus Poribacteria bacterium]
MPKISYAQAGTDALIEEMKRDPTTFHLATSAADELVNEFGSERVRATPIAEGAFTGIAIGAAGSGYRPIINWGMITFSFVAMDQIVNQAAKIHYMFGGQAKF